MNFKVLRITMFASFTLFTMLFTSCTEEHSLTEDQIEAFVTETEDDVQIQTRSGSGSCFELVYPINLIFPDETSQEVDSKEAIKEVAKAWKTDNPDVKGRIKVEFPIDVITADGDLVTVNTFQELRSLRKLCIDRPNHGDKRPCFKLVYPVSVEFPNGNVVVFDSRKELKIALRIWKKNNPNQTNRPSLSFPLTIKLKDGSQIIVNSIEELKEIKESC